MRGIAAKIVLMMALLSLPLQGIVNATMLDCQMQSGMVSMSVTGPATAGSNAGGMSERCKTFTSGVHGAAGCKVCPSCTLCLVAACIDSHTSSLIAVPPDFVSGPIAFPPLVFPAAIKHSPRPSVLTN